ncbi:M20/M25/M40 family metallo-hydrolase [Aestuariivirga sp.]|uniref:M20/M25/M40 family metallo-hydrolase n=1 Tax=Aestuariivirga sp. TaxID=2650926 RepID=UPI0039E5BC4F
MADPAARARELALLFTSWPSVTGTADEAAFPERLHEYLTGFDAARVAAIPDDPFGRSTFFALKRGRSRRTIVLTGHFDTVTTGDYGALQPLALDSGRLAPALIADLRRSGENALALADLEGGDFLPGRGLLDMKAGLAAGLAAMEAYDGEASLLFLAVPDEEERSAGARAAIPQLKQAAATYELDIALVINLDSISDQGDGSTGRIVTYGSIGKQLLCAHVEGKPAHAGYPQDGVNAAYVMAELVRAIELSPRLSEETGQEKAAPPATLFAKDGKQGYNVTTPSSAFAYWNTMQHRQSGADVLLIARELAATAIADAEARTGHRIALHMAADFPKPKLATDHTLSLPDQSRLAFQRIVEENGIKGPAVILGFASIPYPAVMLREGPVRAAISAAVRAHGLAEVNYFAGISDMSFFGEAAGDLAPVAANTPIWGSGFTMPEAGGYPCINIGPWGRDYHTKLERLHAPYAFDTLPRVLLSVIEAVSKVG